MTKRITSKRNTIHLTIGKSYNITDSIKTSDGSVYRYIILCDKGVLIDTSSLNFYSTQELRDINLKKILN